MLAADVEPDAGSGTWLGDEDVVAADVVAIVGCLVSRDSFGCVGEDSLDGGEVLTFSSEPCTWAFTGVCGVCGRSSDTGICGEETVLAADVEPDAGSGTWLGDEDVVAADVVAIVGCLVSRDSFGCVGEDSLDGGEVLTFSSEPCTWAFTGVCGLPSDTGICGEETVLVGEVAPDAGSGTWLGDEDVVAVDVVVCGGCWVSSFGSFGDASPDGKAALPFSSEPCAWVFCGVCGLPSDAGICGEETVLAGDVEPDAGSGT